MFDFVRKHTRILQLILLILILPSFVVFGLQGYDSMNDDKTIAKVAGKKITQAEWDNAHRNLAERTRAQSPSVDPALFDTPAFKQRALDLLLQDYTLSTAAREQNLRAPDARVMRFFRGMPEFANVRNPDGSLNTQVLESQGLTGVQFTERLREQLSVGQVLGGVEATGTPSKVSARLAVDALFQVREVQWQAFDPKTYAAQLNPTPEQLRQFYDQADTAKALMLPERADVQYVVLDMDSLKQGVTISEDDLRKSYQDNIGRYTQAEERRASHILIKAEASAPAAQRQAARAKAEKLLADVKQNPAQFAELARKNSEDPGSAANGGDLDFFPRGAMVKPFEDAAFSLKPGQVSGVVESDFGYHIIQLTASRGGSAQPFEAVRAQIEEDARKELARKAYAEAAEKFTNTVYEQADSLKPVADELKLAIQTATGVPRVPAQGDASALGNVRVLEALFSPTNRSKGRNTEAIEIGPNKLVSARVLKHYPPSKPPFEQAQAQLRERWVKAEALKAARAEADKAMAAWKQTGTQATLPAPVEMSRKSPYGQPGEVLEAVLRIPATQLPRIERVDLGERGTAVVKVNKVLPVTMTPEETVQTQSQFGGLFGKAEAEAYLRALKREHKAKVLVKAPAKGADGEKSAAGG